MTTSIFSSKTVWFNIVTSVVGIAIALQSISTFNKYAGILLGIVAVGNVILRVWFTSTPILATSSGSQS